MGDSNFGILKSNIIDVFQLQPLSTEDGLRGQRVRVMEIVRKQNHEVATAPHRRLVEVTVTVLAGKGEYLVLLALVLVRYMFVVLNYLSQCTSIEMYCSC